MTEIPAGARYQAVELVAGHSVVVYFASVQHSGDGRLLCETPDGHTVAYTPGYPVRIMELPAESQP